MNGDAGMAVILFPSVSHALRAEKILKAYKIDCRLVPVPRHLSSDCGVCLRISLAERAKAAEALKDKVEYLEIAVL